MPRLTRYLNDENQKVVKDILQMGIDLGLHDAEVLRLIDAAIDKMLEDKVEEIKGNKSTTKQRFDY